MRILRTVIALVFLSAGANAQFLQATDNSTIREKQYTQVDGTPYYFDDFKPGWIKDKSGHVTENLMVRYDSYRDDIQFVREGKTLVAAPAAVAEFEITHIDGEANTALSLRFRNGFDVEGFTKDNYFQVVYDGSAKLLAKVTTKYSEEMINNYGTNESVKRFTRLESDYLLLNGAVIKLAKNRKDLLSHFGDHEQAMKEFVKRHKLSVKDDKDVIRIMAEFETLVVKAK